MHNIINWNYNSEHYTNSQNNFSLIPEGNHRVRIVQAEPKLFNSGNEGFEIELEVEGYSSKLWYCMSFDYNDVEKTNRRIGAFFDSFGITDYNLSRYQYWTGHSGVVRVKHNEWQGSTYANVVYCVTQSKQPIQTSQQPVSTNSRETVSQADSRNVFDDCINNSTVNPNRPVRIPVDSRFNQGSSYNV